MHFASGASQVFEKLMKSNPSFDHYDSNSDGVYEECRSECSYEQGTSTAETKSWKGDAIWD